MAGRPSEYDPIRIPQLVAEYVSLCKQSNYLPTLEGLAVHLSISRQTIYEWCRQGGDYFHEEFSDIVEQLMAAQASQLQQNGLVNNYNASITKLLLTKHKHPLDQSSYTDKQEIDHTTKGEKLTVQPILYGDTTGAPPVHPEAAPATTTESTG